jgi:mevalonate kinase
LCVALLKAAAQEAGLHLCSTELIAHATDLEALFHGRSSGIDPSVVVLERPLRFELGQRPQPWSWQLQGLGFVLAVSGEQRNSATAIAKVREFSGGHPTKFEQLLKQAHSIVEQIQDLCQTPTYSPSQLAATGQSLGILLNRHHKLLADLGVSSPLLETLAATARQNGAWGAKLTGAGMGGGLIALAYHKNLAHIAQALRYQGAQEVYIYEPSIN